MSALFCYPYSLNLLQLIVLKLMSFPDFLSIREEPVPVLLIQGLLYKLSNSKKRYILIHTFISWVKNVFIILWQGSVIFKLNFVLSDFALENRYSIKSGHNKYSSYYCDWSKINTKNISFHLTSSKLQWNLFLFPPPFNNWLVAVSR